MRALRVCGTRRASLLGTCPCALVVAGGVLLWRASWPRVVRRASSGPVALGAPVGFPDALVPFPSPGAFALGFTGWLRGARGGRPRTGLIVPVAGPRRGRGAGLAPRRARSGTRDGVVPDGSPPASVFGSVRCGGWRVWTRSLTRLVSRTVRLSTGDSAAAPGLFLVDADTSPCGSEDATPESPVCVRVLAYLGRVGRAGIPAAFWCASPFPLAALSFCFAWPPPDWGCPCLGPLFALPSPLLLFLSRFSVAVFFAPPFCLAFFFFFIIHSSKEPYQCSQEGQPNIHLDTHIPGQWSVGRPVGDADMGTPCQKNSKPMNKGGITARNRPVHLPGGIVSAWGFPRAGSYQCWGPVMLQEDIGRWTCMQVVWGVRWQGVSPRQCGAGLGCSQGKKYCEKGESNQQCLWYVEGPDDRIHLH